METMQKMCLEIAGDEKGCDLPMKQEVEWLAEDTHAPDLANPKFELDMDLLRSIINEQDPDPQIDKYIKTELVLDKELKDTVNDSETNCQPHILPLAHNPLISASTSDKKWENGELPSHSDAPVRLRRGRKRRVHRVPELKCEFCLRVFKKKSDFIRHLQTHSKFKAYFVCEICGSSFTRKGGLKKHMHRKHLDKAQSITPGPKTAAERIIDTRQILNDVQTEQATFECAICLQSLKTKWILKKHFETHSKDRKRAFACDLCDKKFYTKRLLWCHNKTHALNSYPCKVCGQRFRAKRGLKVHMLRREHYDETQQITPQTSNDEDVPIKTELLSDEEFLNEPNERESVSNVEGSYQPSLAVDDDQRIRVAVTCEICQHSYPEELIATHKLITHGDKAYKCKFCPRVCLNEYTFEKHLSTHTKNRSRPYACEQCGSAFRHKQNLESHNSIQHSKNRIAELNCKLCDKKFYSKDGRKFHMRTHTGGSVRCEVCGAHFLQRQGLQRHILSKHKDKKQTLTPDSQIANDDSFQTKEELM